MGMAMVIAVVMAMVLVMGMLDYDDYDGGGGDDGPFQLQHVRAGSVVLLSHHSEPSATQLAL